MQLGASEIALIALAVFLLFGASRLPKIARSVGHSKKALRDALDDLHGPVEPARARVSPVAVKAPFSHLSDEELLAEMERRTASKL